MPRKPQIPPETKPAKMHIWDVCVVADKLRWLGRVEAENEASAIAGIAKQFSKDPEIAQTSCCPIAKLSLTGASQPTSSGRAFVREQ